MVPRLFIYPPPGGDEEDGEQEDVDEPEGMEWIEISGADNRPQSPEIPIDPNLQPMLSPCHYRQPQKQQEREQEQEQEPGQHTGTCDPGDPEGIYGEDNDPHPQAGPQVGEPPAAAHGYRGPCHHGTVEQYQYALVNFMGPETFETKHDAPGGAPPSDPAAPPSPMLRDPPMPSTEVGGEEEAQEAQPTIKYSHRRKPTDPPFDRELADHPEWWGLYIDDGPRRPGEDVEAVAERIRRVRDNMQIEMRPLPPLLPPVVVENTRTLHRAKPDPANEKYDAGYVARWRAEKEARKQRNDERRKEELAFVSLEYIRHELTLRQV